MLLTGHYCLVAMANSFHGALEDRDYASLLARFEGDAELVSDLVDLLLDDYPRQLSALSAAITEGHEKLAERIAHTIKGSVANFAAHNAVEIAQEIELSARDGDLANAQSSLTRLEEEL